MLIYRNHSKFIFVLLVMVTASLAGCTISIGSPTSASPTVSVAPHVTLSAPPTVNQNAPIQLVLDSFGYDGQQVEIYEFFSQFDQPADCTSGPNPITATLDGGPQTVTVPASASSIGDIYWMLSGNGFISECGAVKTRLLALPTVLITSFTGTGYVAQGAGTSASITLADTKSYHIDGSDFPTILANLFEIKGTIDWVGPFQTTPEAEVSPCPIDPVAVTDVFTLGFSTNNQTSTGLTTAVDQPLPISVPGVYRVLLSLPGTEYTAPISPNCENSMLIVVK